jgi:hypothetical protein
VVNEMKQNAVGKIIFMILVRGGEIEKVQDG